MIYAIDAYIVSMRSTCYLPLSFTLNSDSYIPIYDKFEKVHLMLSYTKKVCEVYVFFKCYRSCLDLFYQMLKTKCMDDTLA